MAVVIVMVSAINRLKENPNQRQIMADQEIPAMDYDEHERTYAGFIKLSKWTIVFVVVVLVGMTLLV